MHIHGGRVPDGRGIHNFILDNCKNEYYRKLMLKDRGDMEQITNNENIGYPQLSAVIECAEIATYNSMNECMSNCNTTYESKRFVCDRSNGSCKLGK